MIIRENVLKLRTARKWSQQDLARLVGASQSLIDQIEKGQVLNSKYVFSLARAFDVPLSEIDDTAAPQAITPAQEQPNGTALLGRRDLPIYAATEGGDGSIILSWEPIEFVQRPDRLMYAKKAYGMYVVGESMEPAFERGDLALVNPNVPPRAGLDCVFFQVAEGETKALIKRLEKITTSAWVVLQWNPKEKFSLPKKEWGHCQVVIGKYARGTS